MGIRIGSHGRGGSMNLKNKPIDKALRKQINRRAHEMAQRKYMTYQQIMLCAAQEAANLGIEIDVYKIPIDEKNIFH